MDGDASPRGRASARGALAVVGAASAIGIRPYDGQRTARALDRAPGVLRELGVVERLGADDLGDVAAPPYRDYVRRPGAVRNEPELVGYSRALADRVAAGIGRGGKVLVLGGDCSIVLGCLLAATRGGRRVGLLYVDAHADFATPDESATGSAASMCLALAVGRGDSPLARLGGDGPLVRGEDAVLIGRRDTDVPYGQAALGDFGVLDLAGAALRADGAAAAARALERVGREELDGFWIHVDADVLDPRVMPAVDSPEPGGPGVEELAALLGPLARHPRSLGLQVTIYDPALDPGRSAGRTLSALLERVLADAPAMEAA